MIEEVTLRGTVERITFQNPESGYTVARLDGGRGRVLTVAGILPGLRAGETVEVIGGWTEHPRFGRQFKATAHKSILPATTAGIQSYLSSGFIRGIGPALAERIVSRFGTETLEVIENEPERLREVPGLGEKKLALLRESWQRHRAERELVIFLRSQGIGAGLAARILAHFGPEAAQVVSENPYRLASEVWGIGFLTADAVARRQGVDPSSPERIAAGLVHLLSRAADEGHVFLERRDLLSRAGDLLELGWEELAESLSALGRDGRLALEGERVYLPGLDRAEAGVARGVRMLRRDMPALGTPPSGGLVDWVEREVGLEFAPRQREAILAALRTPLMVLTGGPGTGKTTVVLGVIHVAERLGRRVALAAPTGRAAKRMSEVTGREARTIHRLLEYRPREGVFARRPGRPVSADLVVVDEASMIDLPLMSHLLAGLAPESSLLLVGDVDQLPPVGVGNVLRDIISSGEIEVVRLTQIFRQAEESSIVHNAHRINQGEFPWLRSSPGRERDFFLMEEEDPARIVELITELTVDRLPRRYGFDPLLDVQVVTPMYRGLTGANHLNQVLQSSLNAEGQGVRGGEPGLRVGDKVMQIRNNYEREVFNGDVGVVAGVDKEGETLWVRFDTLVTYPFSDLDELVLAYAITVHKSQGSEYRAVLMPVTTHHYVMLQRNLLYTAVTRARDLVILVGTKRALAIAVRNDRVEARNSYLAERIREAFSV